MYVETHSTTTNTNGLLTIEIGGGKAEQGEFTGIDWANGPYFLKTETDPNGGSDYSVTSTQQLLSVPYAIYAKEAANGFSGDYNDLKNKPSIPQNVGELANDAGYITKSDLAHSPKSGGTDDAGVVQTTACGEIDLCELASQMAQMQAVFLPTVTTRAVSNVTETTVTCGGNVTDRGYSSVTVRGVCWGTEPNPTVSGSHRNNGYGTGAFSISIAGLTAGTTYYVRAYATNSVGTAYGEEVSFTTVGEIPLDTCEIFTLPYSENFESFTSSTTTLTGVEPDCWKLVQQDVTITDADRPQLYYKSSFAHSGNYSLMMRNRCVYAMPALSPDIPMNHVKLTMYLRQANAAYRLEVGVWDDATGEFERVQLINNNSTDVEYVACDFSAYTGNGHRIAFRNVLGSGNYTYSFNYLDDITLDMIFSDTSATLPTVTTSSVSDITGSTATCGGTVTDDGGVAVTGRGVCWATRPNPTVNGSHTSNGTGTGAFTSIITGLEANTTYYVRAYATNGVGRAYGEEVTFTTEAASPVVNGQPCHGTETVTDIDGNVYNTVVIGNQCWMRENLRATKYADGTAIPAGGSTTSNTDPYYYDYSSSGIPLEERGYLYNWAAAMHGATSSNAVPSGVQGICPNGWHLPSDAEWTALEQMQTTLSVTGTGWRGDHAGRLASGDHWNSSSNGNAPGNMSYASRNASGFGAVPAGDCNGSSFYGVGRGAFFWSSTRYSSSNSHYRKLHYDSTSVYHYYCFKNYGFSVRCLRDEGVAIIDAKSCPGTPTVTDHEGNEYATVQIGQQCWMRDNLRTTTSPSTGTYLISASRTNYTYTGKQARWYNNDSATYAPMNYGLLYNWNAAVDTFNTAYGETSVNTDNYKAVSVTFNGHRRGICPVGWHLPSDAEWTTLTEYVGSLSEYVCDSNTPYIAKALASTTGWKTSTSNCAVGNVQSANNASGFGAVPANLHCRDGLNGVFGTAGEDAYFWSATQLEIDLAYGCGLRYYSANVIRSRFDDKFDGYSVRCLRD